MEGNFTVDSLFRFLQTACKSKKDLKAIGLEAVEQASKHMHLLPRLNDKGLLILMVAKILLQKFSEFPQILRLFMAEISPVERAPRVRRANQGGERRRKKRVLQGRDLDLNELSNESYLNPVGVMPPAVGEIRRVGDVDQASKGTADEEEQPVDTNFAEAFTEVQQQLAAERDQNSQATSSNASSHSSRSGLIANFDRKMEIVGEVKIQDRTVRRPRAPPGTGRRTRRKGPIIDEKIDIDEVVPSMGESLDVTMEAIRARHANFEERAIYRQADARLEQFDARIRKTVFSEAARQKWLQLAKKGRPGQRPQRTAIVHGPDITHEVSFEQISQMPESTMFEPPDSAYREHLDSNIFHGEEEVTLKALAKKVKKPKWEVFQNLLWLSQQGEVHLEQANPEAFGEITIFRERKE